MFQEHSEVDLQPKQIQDFSDSVIQCRQTNAAATLELRKSFTSSSTHASFEKIGAMRHLLQLSEDGSRSRMQGSVKVCKLIAASVKNMLHANAYSYHKLSGLVYLHPGLKNLAAGCIE